MSESGIENTSERCEFQWLTAPSCWLKSLNLTERLKFKASFKEPLTEEPLDHHQRLLEWRSPSPFESDLWWQQRLALDNLTEGELLRISSELDPALTSRISKAPEWIYRCIDLLSEDPSAVSACEESTLEISAAGSLFGPVLKQLSHRACATVYQHARRLTTGDLKAPFSPEDTTRLLFKDVPHRLEGILSQTLVLEMHIESVQGLLAGDSPQERFQSFVTSLEQPDRLSRLFAEYPVLTRLVIEFLKLWTEASNELLTHLVEDWQLIRDRFFAGRDAGSLVDISAGLGDLHKRGRSVRVLQFESGSKLVYKPRSLAIDAQFSAWLAWLNERRPIDLSTMQVLDRGTHGWAEFVSSLPCKDRQAVERFYYRQGTLLALLYLLGANDMHRENLVARGEHPILVDLETLLSADFGRSDPDNYESAAEYALDNSIMRIMLLPYFNQGADNDLVESSGLGGAPGQMAVHDSLVWENLGTDQMRLVRRKGQLQQASNRPTLDGEGVNPLLFAEQLEGGFVDTYRWLQEHRQELLRDDSPLMGFRQVEARSVLRASQFYGFILRESYHPDLLRDALDRDRHLDRIWFGIDRSKLAHRSLRLIPGELRDLWRGDLPYFSARADSRDLFTSDGSCLQGFFARSAFENMLDNLNRLGEEDLEEQRWYLRGSLTSLAMSVAPDWQRYQLKQAPPAKVERELLLHKAVEIGERLASLAKLNREGEASWLGLSWTNNRGWWLRPLDYDLYSGLPGIALFLARLGAITGRDDFDRLAAGTIATMERKLARNPKRVRYLGGFDGWGGLIHCWTHLASLWHRDDLLKAAEAMLPSLAAMVDGDHHLDIVRGSAGSIVPLLSLYRVSGSQQALDLACRLGDRLVATAQPFENGRAWLMAAAPSRPLTGFSHGAAGPAWALTEIWATTGDARYRDLALAAVAFEDSTFSTERGNWPDLRIPPGMETVRPAAFMHAWCHGACGIGLARLRMLRHLDNPQLRHDAEAAVKVTAENAIGSNHCLCHGDFGALDLLLEASRQLPDRGWDEELERQMPSVLASIEEHGFLCGIPLKVESPGLMDGLAGMGYGLLRLADPDSVPSILLLDPP